MTAFDWMERFGDGLAFCAVMAACIGLAVACAPPLPERRTPMMAKRSRGGARY